MQRMTEAVDWALCHMPASRWPLRQSTDGYIYDCQACGGRYSIGPSALSHVANGQAPADLLAAVRAYIARGDVPRVAIVGGQWQPLEVMGRQCSDTDPE